LHLSMNIVDITVYGIIIISIAAGFYQGFLATVFNSVGYFIALFSASGFYMGMAQKIKEAGQVIPALLYYSETSDMLGTVETYRTSVLGMTQLKLENILHNMTFPYPIEKWFSNNVLNAVFTQERITNLGDYLSRTVAETSVCILCFLAIFIGVYIAATLVVNLVHYVVKLPSVNIFDSVLGGAVGLGRGILLVFVLFLLMPVILSILPVQQIKDIISSSQTAAFYYQKNFIFDMIKSYIG
jgi:uncharacterized membrane protein required for colicin V production